MSELLAVEGLQKYFPVTRGLIFQKEVGQVKAVDGVSFSVGTGEVVGLLGPNGAGKTTCMNVTVGLLPPRSGEVAVFGAPATGLPPELIAACGVALSASQSSSPRPCTQGRGSGGDPLRQPSPLSTGERE